MGALVGVSPEPNQTQTKPPLGERVLEGLNSGYARVLLIVGLVLFFVFTLFVPMGSVLKGAFWVDARTKSLDDNQTVTDFAAANGLSIDQFKNLNPKVDITTTTEQTFIIEEAGYGLANFTSALGDSAMRGWFANSFSLGFVVTILTFLIALPMALYSVRLTFPLKRLLSALILVPMILPPFVGAIGMQRMLSRFGSINLLLMGTGLTDSPIDFLGVGRFWGVALVEALHLFPIMYLNLASALANVDPTLEEAASSLGDSPGKRFRRVTLPLMLPGIFAGSAIVFVWAFTDLGTPLVFNYTDTVAKRIYDAARYSSLAPRGNVLVLLVLLITSALFLLGRKLSYRKNVASSSKGTSTTPERPATTPERWGAYLLFGGITGLAILPHIGVALSAFSRRWFMSIIPQEFTTEYLTGILSEPMAIISMRNSLILSLFATVFAMIVGVTVGIFSTRKGGKLAPLLDAISMLPLAIPGVVLAFGFVTAYSGTFSWLSPTQNPVILLIASYAIRRLPLVVRACSAGLKQIPPSFEEASLSLGADRIQTLKRITLPLLAAQLIAGGILAFSFAMLEVSDSLILAQQERFYPLTKGIYSLSLRPGSGPALASALGLIGMLLLAGALYVAMRAMGRRLGSLFRV